MITSMLRSVADVSIPYALRRNFSRADTPALTEVENSLKTHYFSSEAHCFAATADEYLTSDAGKKDLNDHVRDRLMKDRRYVIPWLSSIITLKSANILEVGCGTGSSTVALAEQGAAVWAIDVDGGSLAVARDRCKAYRLSSVTFARANATDLGRVFKDVQFDVIAFYASLEHMLLEERLSALREAWNRLTPGKYLAVIDTPNRLWYFDSHTSHLPFFFWLPDDLAFRCARFSPRSAVSARYPIHDPQMMDDFLRRGRGVSYHDFQVALGDLEGVRVAGCLQLHLRKRNPLRMLKWWSSSHRRYERMLLKIEPRVHRAFYQSDLNLMLQKA